MAFDKANFIEELKNMTVLELNEVVKAIEEEFGVSAAAPVAVAAAGGDDAAEAGTVTVTLTAAGATKLAVIKVIRAINPELGLKEAKAVADAGGVIKADIDAAEAKEIETQLTDAGATVEVK